MRITESQLRRIVREEARKLVEMSHDSQHATTTGLVWKDAGMDNKYLEVDRGTYNWFPEYGNLTFVGAPHGNIQILSKDAAIYTQEEADARVQAHMSRGDSTKPAMYNRRTS